MKENFEKINTLSSELNIFIRKFVDIEKEISKDKGAFNLFALFLREDAQDKWDIIVAAPWTDKNQNEMLKYLSNKIVPRLSSTELLLLSRILILDTNNPAVKDLNQSIKQIHGISEISNSNFLGLQIKQAYIITSNT